MSSNLPSVIVTTENGTSWSTAMGFGVTKEMAESYFINKYFDVGVYSKERMEKVINVEYFPANS